MDEKAKETAAQVFPINYRELPLSDDFMFGEVMRREHICKLFLEALLGKPVERIEYITKQQDISDSYTSHGIRMDVYLKDGLGTVYCVEMQTTGGAVLFKRIRYYQGTMDRHNLKKGEHYSRLPQSFIIMVCTVDLFGCGLAIYRRKVIMEGCPDVVYDDGSQVYILNTVYTVPNADDAILEFLNCIRSNDIAPEKYDSALMKEICPAIEEVRSDPGKEAEYMIWETKLMDARYYAEQKGFEKGIEQGIQQGIEQGIEQGVEQGIQQGRSETLEEAIRILITTLKGLSLDRDIVMRQVAQNYDLPLQTAAGKVDQYWAS